MKLSQHVIKNNVTEFENSIPEWSSQAQLVLVFGSTQKVKEKVGLDVLHKAYSNAVIIGCSSSGEICNTNVYDDSIVATAIFFEKSKVKHVSATIEKPEDSFKVGAELVNSLIEDDLKHIFVLSEGLQINGSELVNGLQSIAPEKVGITGGLAGDGADFKETIVYVNGSANSKVITAIGFYGSKLKVGYGSFGGWDSFGIERLVTKSDNNVLYELDGNPALTTYKSFLGEHANNLPSSGLLFPLSLRTEKENQPVVRTILGIDEKNQSLTFAGNIPQGSYVRLMKANFDRLIDGATHAAEAATEEFTIKDPELTILISCVGRKLVLKQMIEEEIEGVKEIVGSSTICGFYSYGEIAPFNLSASCELHNQTMTVTTFKELA